MIHIAPCTAYTPSHAAHTRRYSAHATHKTDGSTPFHTHHSGSVAPGLVGESEVEMYDGDIGETGNYDYLFSSYCPATTAF